MWAKALKEHSGAQVPIPWDLGIQPERGNLMVVMGAPGVGKSLFGLNWCLALSQPSLLVSLDTDMRTQAVRACQILAGVPFSSIQHRLTAWAQYLDQTNLLCRMYDLSIGPRELSSLVEAEKEYWGSAPGLVVVDNVSNFVPESDYNSYRSTFIGLQKVARLHGVAVVALHHVKRDASTGPLSLHSGEFTGEKEAEIVLGLWRSPGAQAPDDDTPTTVTTLNVGILKNRTGPSDPSGGMSVQLGMSSETLRIGRR